VDVAHSCYSSTTALMMMIQPPPSFPIQTGTRTGTEGSCLRQLMLFTPEKSGGEDKNDKHGQAIHRQLNPFFFTPPQQLFWRTTSPDST